MEEYAIIKLEKYNEFLFYKNKYELLKDIESDLIKILESEEFDLENPIHKKIYKVYEKIVINS